MSNQSLTFFLNVGFFLIADQKMPVRKKQTKTWKEIKEITERLHNSSNANTTRSKTDSSGKSGKSMKKDEINNMVERLHASDPHAKRNELISKHNVEFDKTHSDKLGWQTKEQEEINAMTNRLFVADYTNRNVGKEKVNKVKDVELSKDEFEGMVSRLFISEYSNRNLLKNKQFYDVIMNKKKAGEKTLTKEEMEESLGRLAKTVREPAECNKEMFGKQAYVAKGIYGTYAMNGGNEKYYEVDGAIKNSLYE